MGKAAGSASEEILKDDFGLAIRAEQAEQPQSQATHGAKTRGAKPGQSVRRPDGPIHTGEVIGPASVRNALVAKRIFHRGATGRLDKHLGWCQFAIVSLAKLEQLRALLGGYESCLVAYSGGVDSVFLARVAREVLGERSLAVIADSASLPRRELREALDLGERFGFPVRVIATAEFDNAAYLANPVNRCYFCKHELFTELVPLARAEGFKVIAYGENASDAGDFRPGSKAAAEFAIRAPLKEVGLTKAEIREWSARLGLPTADKPQMACLSSRIPHGEAVTVEKLRMVEEAEDFLRDKGFHDVRVRHHELKPPPGAAHLYLARIELGPAEMAALFINDNHARVVEAFKAIGYAHVALDLNGYRRAGAGDAASQPIQFAPVPPRLSP